MSDVTLACVVGARPNFMKMAPLLRAFESHPKIRAVLIHTGQHYDPALSDIFFEELQMPRPDICLEVGSGKHGAQTARILERMEETLERGSPADDPFAGVVVVGDVTSTMAAALAAVKLQIPVAHVEAGLRSRDRTMPEEINRLVTDAISDLLLVSDPEGVDNLLQEGHAQEKVHFVGNVMIDTLLQMLPRAKQRPILQELALTPMSYGVVTLHRPSNVDNRATLERILDVLIEVSLGAPLVFPVHPRTLSRLKEFGLEKRLSATRRLHSLPPLGYLDCLALTSQAGFIVTDSGGLQEESTVLGIPCLTMRDSTERPITVSEGSSTLVGSDADLLRRHLNAIRQGDYKRSRVPDLWDGAAASRIASIIANKWG